MNCPECGNTNTQTAGWRKYRKPTPSKARQYQCQSCFKIFVPENAPHIPINQPLSAEVAGNPDPPPLSTNCPQSNVQKSNITQSTDEPAKTTEA